MKCLNRNERAFTGLEAAIVLIAFVVVAAVFSYVVLGAGFFTTQKSQETVHTGVEQASSNIEVAGAVLAKGGSGGKLANVTFYLQTAAGGAPVNVQNITYTVSTASTAPRVVQYSDLSDGNNASSWAKQEDSDYLLEKFEMYKVTIDVAPDDIVANEEFTIDIVPPKGAALPIVRTAPAEITEGSVYEVW
ncbi:MAG: archaellin/type IV pilin N-terminal domain-containing protein [Methanomicrobiales archaeon]